VAGIFFWISEVQSYDRDGFNFKQGVRDFVAAGCADDPDLDPECETLFKYASGIVNRGCHDPGTSGCPGCVPGATCDPAHHIPERVEASKKALRGLLGLPPGNGGGGGGGGNGGGTCGNGQVGNGVCPNPQDCCSRFGWCGTTADHCGS